MPCEDWRHEWVAQLYDELEPAEQRRLDEHLSRCGACRTTLEELADSRRLLQASAPQAPLAPRVVMIRAPARRGRALWSFAAGMACAALVFVAGLYAGGAGLIGGNRPDGFPPDPAVVTPGELQRALLEQQEKIETKLAAFESRADPSGSDPGLCLTDERLQSELARYREELELVRDRDFRLLAGEIGAVEQRAATWIDENRDALRVALRYRGVGEH